MHGYNSANERVTFEPAKQEDTELRYELISADAAPARPRGPQSARAAIVQAIVADLAPGRVARVEPEGTETVRGTKASLSRAAKSAGRSATIWDSDGVVYVELAGERPVRRRGRPRKNPEA